MFLQSKKNKYIKIRKGKLKKFNFKNNLIKFGEFGLKAKTSGTITIRQIESAKKAITYKVKRKGKLWIRIFTNQPVTSKTSEARMGKGKGSIKHWITKVQRGTILFEICGVPKHLAIEAFKSGSYKLSVKTKFLD